MTGKEKCELFRQIRAEMARIYEIPLRQEPCGYPGDDCLGTCDLCERELWYLEETIEKKERGGFQADRWQLDEAFRKFSGYANGHDDLLELSLDIPDEEEDLTGYVEWEEPVEEENVMGAMVWIGDNT